MKRGTETDAGRSDKRNEQSISSIQRSYPTWHGPNATNRTILRRFMTGDPGICCATRKWAAIEVDDPLGAGAGEKRSSRCVRSATIPWRGCTRIARSMRRNTRAAGRSRTIGRKPSADLRPSIRPGNMSMAGRGGSRSRKANARPCLRLKSCRARTRRRRLGAGT